MYNGNGGGRGSAPLDNVDTVPNSYRSHRDVSWGSVRSFDERRGSPNSARYSSRLSCRSSVRDEAQTIDEFHRKQRVVRYMQIERERAARSKLEREEHEDWVTFRALERAERVKYMDESEISELLQREAKEAELERRMAEEAARRGAEALLDRRRAAANSRPKEEQKAMPGNIRGGAAEAVAAMQRTVDERAKRDSTNNELESLRALVQEGLQREGNLRSKLQQAQKDAAAAKVEAQGAKRALQLAEENQLHEGRRAGEETAARKRAEKRAVSLDERLEELRKKASTLEEELRQEKSNEQKSAAAIKEKEKQLKDARGQLRNAQQENAGLEEKCKQLQADNDGLVRRLKDASHDKAVAKQQAAHAATLEGERELRRKSEVEKAELAQQLQEAESERKRLEKTEEDINSLQKRLEHQGNALRRANDETEALKEQLRNETAVRMKFEQLAAQCIQPRNDAGDKEKLEQAQREAERYQEEAVAVRKELREVRDNADREIASLRAWCNRLTAQCDRQMKELQEQIENGEAYTPRTGRKGEARNGKDNSEDVAEKVLPDSSLAVTKLQAELDEVRKQLTESKLREEHAIALAESARRRNSASVNAEQQGESALQSHTDNLSKNNGDLRVAEETANAALKRMEAEKELMEGELSTERHKVIELQRERDSLLEKVRLKESGKSEYLKVEELKAGSGVPCAGTNGASGDVVEFLQQIAVLREEVEKEKRAHEDAEREAAAQKARADKESEARRRAEDASSKAQKEKAKRGCC
ncbi:200 kDa antigen p200 [Trypanosoma grayi]|uniref:200 kDa antigen p200 n=1 Tax=Trypanosoma grayi TaxID=71804 RepID=UPI0004F46631|nr:200 kDa antigen p200 [Trypanosoma grayi]KEG14028.1 200 kDa antigen p200 [Trypanosoma grayi]